MHTPAAALRLRAVNENLDKVQDFIREQANLADVPEPLRPKLELVAEEVFVNVANHAYAQGQGEVEIHCRRETDHADSGTLFCLSFLDWGPPFNPLESPTPSLEAELDNRPIGGLGIYLVIQAADRCSYARENDTNELVTCFRM